MDEIGVVQTLLDIVERLDIPYMLVGSFSSNAYGVARATQDADLVVVVTPGDLRKLREQLPPGFIMDPQASFETITGKTRHVIEVDEPIFTIELFELGDGDFDQSRFARRYRANLDGRPRFMQTAEDVVVQKLHWYQRARRRKDHDDARDVISIQQDTLEWDYIRTWCDRLGASAALDEVLSSLKSKG